MSLWEGNGQYFVVRDVFKALRANKLHKLIVNGSILCHYIQGFGNNPLGNVVFWGNGQYLEVMDVLKG